jgi:putative oxidoreductase
MERFSRYGILIARVMISMVFLLNALGVIDQNVPAREMLERGAPSALVPVMMRAGRCVELVAGMALILGIFPRLAALALFAFLVPATLVSHSFWLSAGTPAFMGQLINFPKNLAILGGRLVVASTQSQPALSRSIYAKVRNGAVLTTARQPQP